MNEASYRKLLQRNGARYAADSETKQENIDRSASTPEKTEKPPAPPKTSPDDAPTQSQQKRPRRDPDT
ncbi:hypothetical protein D3C83_148590 [compost metagenome]